MKAVGKSPLEQFQTFGFRESPNGTRRIVGAGQKMYLNYRETIAWLEGIRDRAPEFDGVGVFVLPTFPALGVAQQILSGSGIIFGAQDTHWEESGPFTGEVSPLVLRESGCTIVEIGHAERRVMFGETDEIVCLKTAAVLKQGLVPLICIGEFNQQPTSQAIEEALRQLRGALDLPLDSDLSNGANNSSAVMIAYEPVWAIGAEMSAPVDYITPVVAAIRRELAERWPGQSVILYGGSVHPRDAGSLIQAGVDGLFVGRAALNLDQFLDIITSYKNNIA